MNESSPQHTVPDAPIEFTITTQNLDAEEIAAVTAVLQAASAATTDASDSVVEIEAYGWEKSRRDLRTPIHPGPGEWRRAR